MDTDTQIATATKGDESDTISLAKINNNITSYPWICKLMQQCQNGEHSKLREADAVIGTLSEMDMSTRKAFIKVFKSKRYGSFSFVFRAGRCIGFDWKNLYRKPK
jgi:hypothetical protein